MDTRDILLRILFARILLLGRDIILSLVKKEKYNGIDFDELIFPNLKPIGISLPIGEDEETELRRVILHPPGQRANLLAEQKKQGRGTMCREHRHVHCAVEDCYVKTSWLAELNGHGNDFQVISKDREHWTPFCPTHAEWAKTVPGLRIMPFWEVIESYLINIYKNHQPTAEEEA
ncbi:MAG: hypothetical protein AAB731_00490 [Patescibacteria group bacterium]